MKRSVLSAVVSGLVLSLLVIVGATQLPASSPQLDPTDVTPTLETVALDAGESPVCDTDLTIAAKPGGGKGCKDCAKTIGLKCRRISCSPCCYECPDSQFPVCTE